MIPLALLDILRMVLRPGSTIAAFPDLCAGILRHLRDTVIHRMRHAVTGALRQSLEQTQEGFGGQCTGVTGPLSGMLRLRCRQLLQLQYVVWQIDDDVEEDSGHTRRLWCVEELARPFTVRFSFHFCSRSSTGTGTGGALGSEDRHRRKTSRVDRPEWFLAFVRKAVHDYSPTLRHQVQPVVSQALEALQRECREDFWWWRRRRWQSRRYKKQQQAVTDFIECLLDHGVKDKVRQCVAAFVPCSTPVQERAFTHLINQVVDFDRALRQVSSGPISGATSAILSDPRAVERWISLDWRSAKGVVLPDLADWGPHMATQHLLALGQSDLATLDTLDDLKLSVAAHSLVRALQAMNERYECIRDPAIRAMFISRMQCKFIEQFLATIQANMDCALPAMGEHAGEWEKYCSMANSAAYVESTLQEWEQLGQFVELRGHRDLQGTSHRSMDKHSAVKRNGNKKGRGDTVEKTRSTALLLHQSAEPARDGNMQQQRLFSLIPFHSQRRFSFGGDHSAQSAVQGEEGEGVEDEKREAMVGEHPAPDLKKEPASVTGLLDSLANEYMECVVTMTNHIVDSTVDALQRLVSSQYLPDMEERIMQHVLQSADADTEIRAPSYSTSEMTPRLAGIANTLSSHLSLLHKNLQTPRFDDVLGKLAASVDRFLAKELLCESSAFSHELVLHDVELLIDHVFGAYITLPCQELFYRSRRCIELQRNRGELQ